MLVYDGCVKTREPLYAQIIIGVNTILYHIVTYTFLRT